VSVGKESLFNVSVDMGDLVKKEVKSNEKKDKNKQVHLQFI
jgi:hypothetical protein